MIDGAGAVGDRRTAYVRRDVPPPGPVRHRYTDEARALLDVAAEADRRGFAGLASPGIHGNLALCGSLAHVTTRDPVLVEHPADLPRAPDARSAITAGHLAEVSDGRFRLGLGVSHEPAMQRLGIATGKPLSDMRDYVASIRAAERPAGPLPPIWLATLRDRMLDLAHRGRRRGDLGQRLVLAHAHPAGADPRRAARARSPWPTCCRP